MPLSLSKEAGGWSYCPLLYPVKQYLSCFVSKSQTICNYQKYEGFKLFVLLFAVQ